MFMPRLSEIATTDVITLGGDASVFDAAQTMERHNIRDIIVVAGEGDFRIFDVPSMIAYRLGQADLDIPLDTLNLEPVPTIREDADVLEGMELIRDHGEHICLVDGDGALSGIVSYSDLLASLDPKVMAENRQLGEMLVGTKFFSVDGKTRVAEVFERMYTHGHGEAIVTESGRAVGILTRGDVIRLLTHENSLDIPLETVASRPLVGVSDTTNIQDALAFCKTKHFKRIVVQNSSEEVIGIVTQKELVTLFYNRWSHFLTQQKEELKNLNSELQSQKETLEHITDTIGEGLYVMDAEGIITHLNESMADILGYRKEELLGQSAHTMFHSHYQNDNIPLEACPIFRTIQSRRSYEGVEEFITKDGNIIQVRVTSHPMIREGRVTGSVTTFSDISDELKMQEQVRQSEAWFRGLFDLSPDGVVIIDPRTTGFRDFNRAAYENLGYSAEEFARLRLEEIDAVEDLQTQQARIREIMERGRSDFETKHRAQNGEIRPVLVSVKKMEIKGEPYLMATWRDISELKKAESELKEHETMLRTIYDVLPVGITISDPGGNIVDCNAASEVLLGIGKEEHLARDLDGKEWEIIRPDGTPMPPREFASVRALKERRVVRDVEMGIVRQDGTVWLSVSAMPVADPRYGVVVAYADITERREYEMRLRDLSERLAEQVEHEVAGRLKNEAKYRNLFNAVPDAIVIYGLDKNGVPTQFTEVNDRASKLFGIEREELLKCSPGDVCPHGRLPRDGEDKIRELKEKGIVESEEELTLPDGTVRHIERTSIMQTIAGQKTVFTVLRDVTTKKALENEHELNRQLLIQQSKMAEMGSMVGVIAHQWKQPLNTIGLIVQDLADCYDYGELDSDMLHSQVDKAMQQVEFMGRTIDDFRNFFKPSKQVHRFGLTRCVNETVGLLKPQLDKNGVLIAVEGDPSIEVEGYENELKQVILNIINNAKDALLEKGIDQAKIDVSVKREDKCAVLRIGDNAGGIPEALLPDKLFEPFASTKGEKGTGIGLALARQIVAKMEGKISAANGSEGAVFEITIPCAKKR